MNSIGSKEDSAASADSGTFSLIALVKRLLLRTPGGPRAGISANVTVGVASQVVLAGGATPSQVTIQNTSSAAQNIFVSFTNPATAADFKLIPGATLTLPFGPTNALYGLSSAAAGSVHVITS